MRFCQLPSVRFSPNLATTRNGRNFLKVPFRCHFPPPQKKTLKVKGRRTCILLWLAYSPRDALQRDCSLHVVVQGPESFSTVKFSRRTVSGSSHAESSADLELLWISVCERTFPHAAAAFLLLLLLLLRTRHVMQKSLRTSSQTGSCRRHYPTSEQVMF